MKRELYEALREYNQNIEQELLKADDKSLIMKWWDILNYLAK